MARRLVDKPSRAREEAESNADNPLPDGRGSECVNAPLAYLITFTTYGTWLHGDGRESVDREHNIPGTPFLPPDTRRQRADSRRLQHRPIILDAGRREIVHRTILEVCEHRGWGVQSVNVRSNHVHVVVTADSRPERVMNDVKSWATRRMVEAGVLKRGTKAWTRHGSTRYLWKPKEVEAACRYVCEGQGADLPGGR